MSKAVVVGKVMHAEDGTCEIAINGIVQKEIQKQNARILEERKAFEQEFNRMHQEYMERIANERAAHKREMKDVIDKERMLQEKYNNMVRVRAGEFVKTRRMTLWRKMRHLAGNIWAMPWAMWHCYSEMLREWMKRRRPAAIAANTRLVIKL